MPEEPLQEEKQKKKKGRKKGITSITGLFITVLFGLSFSFQARMGELGPLDDISEKFRSIFEQFYLFFGFGFGFLSMLLYFIIRLLLRKVKKLDFLLYYISILVSILPWCLVASILKEENRYTDLGKSIISYVGFPLQAAARMMLLFLLIYFIITLVSKLVKRKNMSFMLRLAVILTLPVFLSGCIGGSAGIVCWLLPDSDHCYQAAAVQEADVAACAKIKGEDFEGSNPPRDKCYLNIAKNTGDLSICDNIAGGMYSYTKEECYMETAIIHENPDGCLKLSGADKASCIDTLRPHITSGSVIEIDEQIKVLEEELKKNPDASLQEQLTGLKQKRENYLDVMTEEGKKEYESISDPRNQDALLDYHLGKIDKKTKDSLIALNNALREKGNPMSEKEYQMIRDTLAYKNDPKNNVENMPDHEIVQLRWNEKLANGAEFFKFWKANKTTTEQKYDEQLQFYERMLERQASIEKGLSQNEQDLQRNLGMIGDKIKDTIKDTAIDEAKKAAFGELLDVFDSSAAGPTTAILGEAIEVVKAEAKSKEFRGLVRAYNKGMEEELIKSGGNIEQAHANVVKNLNENAYTYEDQNSFAKYENLLINKDCDGSNPHCLHKDMFWKSMKKSYKYQQNKK